MGKKRNYVLRIIVGLGLAIVVTAVLFIVLKPIMASNERVFLYSQCQCMCDDTKYTGFISYSSYEKRAIPGGYEPLNDIKTKRTSIIDNRVIYTYEISDWEALSGDTDHKKYEYVYDRYKGSDGSYVEYWHGSDIMTGYSITRNHSEVKIVKSATDAKKIADDFLKQIGIYKYLDEYTYNGYDYHSSGGWHYIEYQRYAAGYPTDDRIYVMIENDGTVSQYVALNFGKYNKYEKVLTEERIEEATRLFYEKISVIDIDNLRVKDNVRIVSDITTTGEPFLCIEAECDSHLTAFYVSLK